MGHRDREAWPARSDDDAEWRHRNVTSGREAEWETIAANRPRVRMAPVRQPQPDANVAPQLPRARALDRLFRELVVDPDFRREFEVAPNRALKRVRHLSPEELAQLQKVPGETLETLAETARRFAEAAKAKAVAGVEAPWGTSGIQRALDAIEAVKKGGGGPPAGPPGSASGDGGPRPDGLRGGSDVLSLLDQSSSIGANKAERLPFDLPFAKPEYGGLSRGWWRAFLSGSGIPLVPGGSGGQSGGGSTGGPGLGQFVDRLDYIDDFISGPGPTKAEIDAWSAARDLERKANQLDSEMWVITSPDPLPGGAKEMVEREKEYERQHYRAVKDFLRNLKDAYNKANPNDQVQTGQEVLRKANVHLPPLPPPPPPPPKKKENPNPDDPGGDGQDGPWIAPQGREAIPMRSDAFVPNPDDPDGGPIPWRQERMSGEHRGRIVPTAVPNPDDPSPSPGPWWRARTLVIDDRFSQLGKPNPDDPGSPVGPALRSGRVRRR